VDRKSITITGIDIDKDKDYSGNSWKIIEDWNKKGTREFFSKSKKQI